MSQCNLLVNYKVRVVSKFSVVQCSTEKAKEEATALSDQWCCGEVTSGQRTDLKSISGYGWWDNNCSKYQ